MNLGNSLGKFSSLAPPSRNLKMLARELPIDGVNSNWLLSKITSKVKKSVKLQDLDKEIYDCNMKINLTLGAGDIGSKAIKIKKQLLEYAN